MRRCWSGGMPSLSWILALTLSMVSEADFDEEGAKWFQSPNYKEVKTEVSAEDSAKLKEYSKRFNADSDKDTKLKRERFYDLYSRMTNDEKFKVNVDELNLSLNLRIDDFPDDLKITAIFEELNSKSAMISRGKKNWSEQETFLCIWIVMAYCNLHDRDFNDMLDKDWDGIARVFPGKSAEQCKVRWQGLLKTNLTKAPWTQEEDKILSNIIQEKGPKKWKEIACELNKKLADHKVFRQGKQCRERWINHLDPSINRGAWSNEEDIKLLETHMQIGKKWAEISKILRNRTENAVKNRWNSLMKKYKGELEMDFDTLSTSSAYSNKSMDNLERKIAEMIISTRKGKDSKSTSPDLVSPGNKILEVNEDDSPDNMSDISAETPFLKTEDSIKSYSKREEEMDRNDSKSSQKKGAAAKKKPNIHAAKTFLREMITEEIQNQPQAQSFPPNNIDAPLSAQKMYAFDENVALNTANQEQIMSSQSSFNSAPMPLFNQHSNENRSNMINEINMWRNNLNNMNIFTQSPQQNSLSSSLLGFCSPGSFLHQPGFNLASATLPMGSNNNVRDNKVIKLNETKPDLPPVEPKTYKLTERPINQFTMPEAGQSGLYYAVVDLSGGQMYLLDQVSKDNYPPALNQTKQKMETSLNNLDFFGNSPSLNHASWKSPPINTNALSNYPLFNNALNSFNLGKNPFSPNLFANAPQFDQGMFESTPKMESVGSGWTPTEQRPLFQGLNMKQYYANSIGDTPPDMRMGGGALFGRIDPTKINSGASTEGGLKYSSPSSFLTSSQPSHLNRNVIKTGFEKI